jgi:hypothetical protein
VTDGEDRLGSFDEPLSEDSEERAGEVPDPAAPTIEPPRPETPTAEAPEPGESHASRLQDRYDSADPEFKTLFWKLVVLYKFGIVGLSLGALILLFDAHPTAGPVLLLGGLAFGAHALYLTYRGKTRLDAGEFDFETADEPDTEHDQSTATAHGQLSEDRQ